jgi:MFS family permease
MTRAQAADHTALMLAGFAVGSFVLGTVSDRLGRRRPVMLAALVLYLACWLLLLSQIAVPRAASLALFAVMGFATAGFTLVWAVAKEVNRPALSGMATSVVNTGAFLGGALLQPFVGLVMDLGWDGRLDAGVRIYSAANYRAGLAVMTAFAALGLIGALFVRETYCRYVAGADQGEARSRGRT